MKHLPKVFLVILLVLLVFPRIHCGNQPQGPVIKTTIIRDTVWKIHDTVIKKTVRLVKTIHDTLPGSIDTVEARDYYNTRIYEDSVAVDSFGHILVRDTVQYNKLKQRTYINHYRIPVVTKTVTVIQQQLAEPQFYTGGSVRIDGLLLQSVNAGILYKSKKDRLYGFTIGINNKLRPQWSIELYRRIR